MERDVEEMAALGQFLYDVSRLQQHLRGGISDLVQVDVPVHVRSSRLRKNLMLMSGTLSLGALVDTFFGVASEVADYTPEETKMASLLKNRIRRIVERRNDFMHGEWSAGREEFFTLDVSSDASQLYVRDLPASLHRTKTGAVKSPRSDDVEYSMRTLADSSKDVQEVSRWVGEWTRILCGQVRIYDPGVHPARQDPDGLALATPKDVFAIVDGGLLREGACVDRILELEVE